MELTTAQSSSDGGCIILLDVPPGSSITLDGITRLTPSSSLPNITSGSSSTISSPPFNGVLVISDIPSPSASLDQFHLLIVRCSSSNKNQSECNIRTLPVGFILTNNEPSCSNHKYVDSGYDWIFARRYDPQTEEISNNPIDELTLNNLLLAMRKGGELAAGAMMGRNLIMSYEQFMQTTPSKSGDGSSSTTAINSISSWGARTTCITSSYLHRCHTLIHGDKIVPSSYNQEEVDIHTNRSSSNSINEPLSAQDDNVDGKQISYPQIPCIDPSINARQLTQHAGTRSYLSKISPETRTKLLFGGRGGDSSFHAGEYVWNDILSQMYNSNENDFLADVQLSFLMFLFLECHTSLEHWRDAVSMCSLAVMPINDFDFPTNANKKSLIHEHTNFFQQLLSIIHHEFLCIESEFFQEVEYSSGQRNFLIQALERLCGACDGIVENSTDEITGLKTTSSKLKCMLRDRFHLDLSSSLSSTNDADMEIEAECPPIVYENNKSTATSSEHNYTNVMEQDYDDDDDEDGPVIVPYEEFESSISRSAAALLAPSRNQANDVEEAKHRLDYPLLFAAKSSQEDIVMCAARVLDEQGDVSLVREAAAYLEKVEAHRCCL